ncbi:hypothetical protein F5J12DRAFT_957417 [Pisolithus orientalis]|uniref:uncharacterized protein n=1 Tax=Pisolithus orientalis TaxID=936130 RepID=UPI0022254042|nr:uncharacterized protein F5J12DRAFT_957417 [Pisolithus orientalis]KAI5996847.1 hypothetical protein F5J12DRAFT_957417 [Pisolithus orientalis]
MVLPIAAAIVTSFRLFVRTRQRRLWLDDAWAALAMIFNIGFLIVLWLYLHNYGDSDGLRSSRISILFTVVRLTFPGSLRRWLVRTAVAFIVTWMILFAQIFWVCEAESGWKTRSRLQCDLGRDVAIALIITDVLSDTILILAPIRLIYRVRLTKAEKIRLLSIFSTSSATTIVSLAHAYYVLSDGGLKEVIAAAVEVSVSLIVANLNVVVAFLFHISTEEQATPAPLELSSIITIGSQSTRKRVQCDPLSLSTMEAAIEIQTIKLDDFNVSPEQAAGRDDKHTEVASLETLVEPGLFYVA